MGRAIIICISFVGLFVFSKQDLWILLIDVIILLVRHNFQPVVICTFTKAGSNKQAFLDKVFANVKNSFLVNFFKN